MSNNYNGCNNNCEAVAGLQEKAANLVAYSNLINAWLNGPATGTVNIAGTNTPTLLKLITDLRTKINQMPQSILLPNGGIKIDSNGKLYIDFNSMPPELLYALLQKIVLQGGGLAFDNSGKMFVDFANMPTNKFDDIIETFRKGLRLQKYLSANTIFYVRKMATNATDIPPEGEDKWGQSESKPFKTIQGAINYVTENYNIGKFTATIDVSGHEYGESVTLNDYNHTTGRMVLRGVDTVASDLTTTIKKTNQRLLYIYPGSAWTVKNIKVQQAITAGVGKFTTCIHVGVNSELSLDRFEMVLDCDGENVPTNTFLRPIAVDGNLYLLNTSTDGASKITTIGYEQGMDGLFRIGSTGYIEMRQAPAAFSYILCSGKVSTFMVIVGGRFAVNTGYTPPLGFQNDGVTGRRFNIINGGQCSVIANPGQTRQEYFPGSAGEAGKGDVDALTYSWYK